MIRILALCVAFVSAAVAVEIISIIDHLSVASCLLKVHSVIQSASNPATLSFIFLLMKSEELQLDEWDKSFAKCFPNVKFESKVWERPLGLMKLSGNQFEKDVIFARFYLVDLFPKLKRFIYLDNDIIVTADLYDLYSQKLMRLPTVPNTDSATVHHSVHNPRTVNREVQRPHVVNKPVGPPATVGFVYETHPGYRQYFQSNFNMSHPWVRSIIEARGTDTFMNGGVFVVDAVRWRANNFTARAEAFFEQNERENMYNTAAVGDQGPFLLLFHSETAYLLPKYNMRRLPKKTIQLLNDGQTTGIVHFAGTTRADAEVLCRDPLRYPIFLHAALPLYLSVALSFARSVAAQCPLRVHNSSCAAAVPVVQAELARLQVKVNYNPGLGDFKWPPSVV